jgi:hypothetical protein
MHFAFDRRFGEGLKDIFAQSRLAGFPRRPDRGGTIQENNREVCSVFGGSWEQRRALYGPRGLG